MRTTKHAQWRLATGIAVCLLLLGVPAFVLASGQAHAEATGMLEICKEADGPSVSGSVTFEVGGRAVAVPVGACSAPLELPTGPVTVLERPVDGFALVAVSATPGDRLVATDLDAGTARVAIVAGDTSRQTAVTFTNRAEFGPLKVCKVAGSGVGVGLEFSFLAGGQSVVVPAGPAPGGYCAIAGSFPVGTAVAVSEDTPRDIEVTSIGVAPAARLVGAPNLDGATVVVRIGSGFTEATFTNQAANLTTTPAPTTTPTTSPTAPPPTTPTPPTTTVAPPTTATNVPPTTVPPTTVPPTTGPPPTVPVTSTTAVPVVTLPPTTAAPTTTIPSGGVLPISVPPASATTVATTTTLAPLTGTTAPPTTTTVPSSGGTSPATTTVPPGGVPSTLLPSTPTTTAVAPTPSPPGVAPTTALPGADTGPPAGTAPPAPAPALPSTAGAPIARLLQPSPGLQLSRTGASTAPMVVVAGLAIALGALLLWKAGVRGRGGIDDFPALTFVPALATTPSLLAARSRAAEGRGPWSLDDLSGRQAVIE